MKKIKLSEVKNALKRDELRAIKGGSIDLFNCNGTCNPRWDDCGIGKSCQYSSLANDYFCCG